MKRAALGLLVMMGCTGDDAPTERGPVSVRVIRDEMPVANAAVVFHDANGRVLGSTRTDAAGGAAGEISTWGMVTIGDPDFDQRFITMTHLALGATIEVPLDGLSTPGAETALLQVAAPAGSPPPGTVGFYIQTPCGSGSAASLPATVPLHAGCNSADIPVVILARSANVSFEDPGRALAYVAGRATNLAFQPSTWSTDCTQVAVATDLEMSFQLWPRLYEHAFRSIDLAFCAVSAVPPGYTARPTLDFAEGAVAHGFGYVDGAPLRTASLLVDLPAVPSTFAITRADDLLIGDPELVAFGGGGARWSAVASLAAADAILAELTWSLAPLSYVEWRFVLPPGATAVSAPALPDDVRTWATLDQAVEVIVGLRYLEASWVEDLDGVYAHLPLMIEGAASRRSIERQGSLRDYIEQFHPSAM